MSGSSVYNTIDILCTGGVTYALYSIHVHFISLLISKLFCTKGCVGTGLGWVGSGCHFMAQKCLDFQGPLLSVALEIDLPASKSLRPASYKQQVKLI